MREISSNKIEIKDVKKQDQNLKTKSINPKV